MDKEAKAVPSSSLHDISSRYFSDKFHVVSARVIGRRRRTPPPPSPIGNRVIHQVAPPLPSPPPPPCA
ncbi:hypothetical protein DITRI_Ditri06bG0143800 [Diplodiscus trichospermus]